MQDIQVQSLGQEDPLGKEMATHSSILVWRIPWTEKPGGLQSMGLQVGHDLVTEHAHTSKYYVNGIYALYYFVCSPSIHLSFRVAGSYSLNIFIEYCTILCGGKLYPFYYR